VLNSCVKNCDEVKHSHIEQYFSHFSVSVNLCSSMLI